jgi:predicted nucleotidyltransferase
MVNHLLQTLRDYFQHEAIRFEIKAVFLFGSQAASFSRPDSDVDLAIVFEEEIPEQEIFERMNTLTLRLTEILDREVNLIAVDKEFSKPMLYYNAIVQGVPIFTVDHQYYTGLVNEALYQMEDFEIFGRGWQIDLAKRNLEEIRNG